jgi:Tol biopolymer transport system component
MKRLLVAGVRIMLLTGIAGSVLGQTAGPGSGVGPVLGRRVPLSPTTRVSVDSAGAQANSVSLDPSISFDGRCVAFRSLASNLVPLDTNRAFDIFVHDRASGTTTRVSVDSAGEQGNADSFDASISPDGRYVAFGSLASNLVPLDTNGAADAFVHDRARRTTTRVSVSSAGVPGNAHSFHPAISSDSRYVAFHSRASNLVPIDTNVTYDIFVHDRRDRTTKRVSVSSEKVQGNSASLYPWISSDGHYVVFESAASNLVPRDTNGATDVFVHDRENETTTRVSVSSEKAQGNSASLSPSISSTGRYVGFRSFASNLVPLDTNGGADVFVHDLESGTTKRVSFSSAGVQADASSFLSSISSDGRFVAFESLARNLVPSDTNDTYDVFVNDRASATTTRVSVSPNGAQGHLDSLVPSISSDGRYVAFVSFADNLVPLDTNFTGDIFVHRLFP